MHSAPKVITVVCTGNICRSPMAERLLSHALQAEPEPLRSCRVVSAGVAAFPGDPPSGNAVRALKAVGLDLGDHRSRPLSDQLADDSDLILAMTTAHVEAIRERHPEIKAPVFRFREWVAAGPREVADPFGGGLDVYTETRDNLAEAIPSIIAFLKSGLNP
jgi:protein-tyrosine-phosphatase